VCVAGVGGDKVEHMIWRVEDGSLFAHTNPKFLKKVIIISGANNIMNLEDPRIVAKKVGFLVDLVKTKVAPDVVVEIVVPPVAMIQVKQVTKQMMVERCIYFGFHLQEEMKKRNIFVHKFQNKILTQGYPKTQNQTLFLDGVHLNREGYELLATTLFSSSK